MQTLTEAHLIGRLLAIFYRQGMGNLERVWQYIGNAIEAVRNECVSCETVLNECGK